MNDELLKLCTELTESIKSSYESGVTMDEAEKLASKFLYAQIKVSDELRNLDLDSRMKKNGLKAVKAAVYMQEATKTDKKPSDTFLQNIVDRDELVNGEQQSFDKAEAERAHLENLYNIFKDAHIHFRGISKGRFE